MKKLLQILSVMLLFAGTAFAQQRTITGTVTNKEDGTPIPGVSVKLVGTRISTQAGADGKFTITGAAGQSLQITSVGYTAQTIAIGASNVVRVQLQTESNALTEVIVVAYGTTTKGAFTGAASKVGADDIKDRGVSNLNSALSGAAPGVQVNAGSGQPGSGPSVRIRGFGSISASNDPLYIVDGIQYSGNISNINVDDIESISILKDAASSSLYGSSAANGVVLVTTKKGRQGKEQLTIRAIQGVTSRGIPEYDRVGAYDYYPAVFQAYRNSLLYPTTGTAPTLAAANATARAGIKGLLFNNPFNVADADILNADGTMNPNAQLKYDDFNWIEDLERVGKRGDYSMAVSGANEKSDYYMSLGYVNEQSYLVRSDFNRFSGRASINTRPTSWFKTGLNLTGNVTTSNQADTGSGSIVNPFNFTRTVGPIYPVYVHDPVTGAFMLDSKGQKIYDLGNLAGVYGIANRPAGALPGRHTVQETLLNQNAFRRNVLGARTYGEITFLKDFKFTTNIGFDGQTTFTDDFQNKIVGDGAPSGRARNTAAQTFSYTVEQLLNYNKKVGEHNFGGLLGHNNYSYRFKNLTAARNTQILDGITELVNFATTTDADSQTDTYRKEAYFARLNYDYQSKYFLSGAFRRDASSKWSPNDGRQWGDFWSISGAWLISEESWMKSAGWINYLKLRSSHGSLGNDGIDGYYLYQGLYALGVNNGSEAGIRLSTLANPDITWETQTQTDLALEFAMFKNRLHGSVEVYNKNTTDLLFSVPLPISVGITSINKNLGTMYNRGLEINLGGDVIRAGEFKWNMDINAAFLKNKITKMPNETPTVISGTKQLAVGHGIYDYWLRQWEGVNPADGMSLYQINPLSPGVAADQRTVNGQTYTINPNNARFDYSGTAIPKVAGAVTNTFSYGKITLSVQTNYGIGGKIYDSNYLGLMSYASYGGSLHADALKSWQAPGDTSPIPRLDVNRSTFNNAASTRWLTDASYLSLRAATVSYDLPKRVISKVGLSNLRVFGTGENILMISKRSGMDPTSTFTGTVSDAYSPTRTISLGINASF